MKSFITAFFYGMLAAFIACCTFAHVCSASETPDNFLDRPHDAIVISGEKLAKFEGESLKRLRLMSYRDGKLEVIPFQIDEKDRKGRYIFSHVLKGKKWQKPEIVKGQNRFHFRTN